MKTCATDEKEGRHVLVIDISVAFLHANINIDVHMVLKGAIAELIVNLEPKLHRNYVWK